jgi:hypothetical protein
MNNTLVCFRPFQLSRTSSDRPKRRTCLRPRPTLNLPHQDHLLVPIPHNSVVQVTLLPCRFRRELDSLVGQVSDLRASLSTVHGDVAAQTSRLRVTESKAEGACETVADIQVCRVNVAACLVHCLCLHTDHLISAYWFVYRYDTVLFCGRSKPTPRRQIV